MTIRRKAPFGVFPPLAPPDIGLDTYLLTLKCVRYGHPYGHLTARELSRAGDSSDVDSTIASDGTERPTFDEELRGIAGDKGSGNVTGGSVIEGLEALRVEPYPPVVPDKQAWAAKLFPKAKPTPVTGGWTAPTRPHPRREIVPSDSGSGYRIRTDWDNMALERDEVDDMYHCPFSKCV